MENYSKSLSNLQYYPLKKIMCSIADLFDTNIRKFDAKKTLIFFCPECSDSVNH